MLNQFYLDRIKKFEGFEPRAKWDYQQYTNGYGTRAKAAGETIDKAEAERRFQTEIGNAEKIVDGVNINMPEGVRAALVDLTFNAGDKWTRSGLGSAVRDNDWNKAGALLKQYNKAGGATNSALVDRRNETSDWLFGKQGPPRPPGDIPMTDKAYKAAEQSGAPVTTAQAFSPTATAQQSAPLGNTAAATVAPASAAAPAQAAPPPAPDIPTRMYEARGRFPDFPPPRMASTGTDYIPMPPERPAGAGPAVPADQKPVSTPAPKMAQSPPKQITGAAPQAAPSSRGGLGNQMPVAGGYIDPATNHQIVNPSGSGEQAMGLTRDVGVARQAPAPARAASPPGQTSRGPSGPVPRAPEAAGALAKPENMPAPEQTLKALDASRQKPNTLTSLYNSQTPPTNPPPGATFQDIANAPPQTPFGAPKGSTLTDLPLPPYNVGGPGGTPLPPPRPLPGLDLGAPVARNFLRPGPAATPQEQDMRAQQAKVDAARNPAAPGGGPLAFSLPQGAPSGPPRSAEQFGGPGTPPPSGLVKAMQDAVAGYKPGFLDTSGPSATPQEAAMRDMGVRATSAALPFSAPPPTPPPPSAGAPQQPQQQSMLPPWQQQQQLPLSPYFNQQLPGQGWPNWQNFDTSFSGGNMGDFAGFSGGGGGEGFAFTPG